MSEIELKRELKRKLKRELKREIKREIKRELNKREIKRELKIEHFRAAIKCKETENEDESSKTNERRLSMKF